MPSFARILENIDRSESEMRALLRRSIGFRSVSGQEAEFVRFLTGWAQDRGFEIDLWESKETELQQFAVAGKKHIPLAGRPTAVVRLPGNGAGKSLLFNGHSDVVIADGEESAWTATEQDGKLFGRGSCDVKGGLVSALWAMDALRQCHPDRLPGDILLELVPGEEDCVTLGTATSIARGYTADACIVLEPTESLPRNASRGGLRFEIVCHGKAVHGTVKWLGEDAITLARVVLDALEILEKRWDVSSDPWFAGYPIARPVTVDLLQGGTWQGMICDRCRVAGYLELLPADELMAWKKRFTEELHAQVAIRAANSRLIEVSFPEEYEGFSLPHQSDLCNIALSIVEQSTQFLQNAGLQWNGWAGFNSGCEAGLRARFLGTPTLVWGPGSLAQAHTANEFVEFAQVRGVAEMFARFASKWIGPGRIVS